MTREVGRTLLIIGLVALLAVVAAVLLAIRQANRLASPLTDLAETAERLGSGDPRPRHKRYGVPELDRVADVLDSSAERIARMLTAERRLAADASHQLRTPLTALSMRLEEITLTDDPETVKEEATIALSQVERLTDVVDRLLTNSRDPRSGSAVTFELDDVIQQQIDEWRPAYRSEGRAIVSSGKRHLTAVGTPGAVAQVLAALIENSLMHGGGTVALRTRVTGNQAVVEVTDEGPACRASWGRGSSNGRSAGATPRASAWPSPATSPRPTAAGWNSSRAGPRCSVCSSPAPSRRRRPGTRGDGALAGRGAPGDPPAAKAQRWTAGVPSVAGTTVGCSCSRKVSARVTGSGAGSVRKTHVRYDQKRKSVPMPMPRNLKMLLCSGLSQPKPYVAV